MKKVRKYFISGVLTIVLLLTVCPKANSGAQVFGIGGFSDDAFNTAIVGTLSRIEALNAIANSNTVQTMLSTLEMAEKMKKVITVIQEINDVFKKSKIVMEMAAMTVNIYNEYIAFVQTIYHNEELLELEEIEMFVNLLDYAIFDKVAEKIKKQEDASLKHTAKDVAGGAFQQLEDIFQWIKTSHTDKDHYTALEAKVAVTYNKLSRTSRDLRIMRKYCYSYMVSKRYRRGAFDNGEYIKYVYYSKFRQQAVQKYR
ncbi:hypothetical protein AGMMS4956_19730 [Bacteroidia bacterium]|nr:hypothetical protein AGMMS4956_19730 [Bacteroidia bacterium]